MTIIMRLRAINRLMVLGALVCVTSIAAGCRQHSKPDMPGDLGSSVSTTPVAPPGSQRLPGPDTGFDKQHAQSLPPQSSSKGAWLLQPGLFSVQHGMCLGWISFVFGFFGIVLAVYVLRRFGQELEDQKESDQKLVDRNDKLSERIENLETEHGGQISELYKQISKSSAQLNRLLMDYQQLEYKQAAVLGAINSLRVQQKPEPQSYATPAPSLISTPLVACQPSAPSPAQKQAELTAAVNRGDRQVVKAETRAQLNITHASENAISMGRLNETQLEEVSAGGSYWAATFAGETWLYPTEQTLKGYSQTQRPTGIFQYNRQPIHSAQVVSPARLTLSGGLWQVVEMGSIAVPG